MGFRNPDMSGWSRGQQAAQMNRQYGGGMANMMGGRGGAGNVLAQMGFTRGGGGLPPARRTDPMANFQQLLQTLAPSGYPGASGQQPDITQTGDPTEVISVQGQEPRYINNTPQYGTRTLVPPQTPPGMTPPTAPTPYQPLGGHVLNSTFGQKPPTGLPQVPAQGGTPRPPVKPGAGRPYRPRWLTQRNQGYGIL